MGEGRQIIIKEACAPYGETGHTARSENNTCIAFTNQPGGRHRRRIMMNNFIHQHSIASKKFLSISPYLLGRPSLYRKTHYTSSASVISSNLRRFAFHVSQTGSREQNDSNFSYASRTRWGWLQSSLIWCMKSANSPIRSNPAWLSNSSLIRAYC